jgi:hypothetical protein
MTTRRRCALIVYLCLTPFLCASCLSMSLPKISRDEPSAERRESSSGVDKSRDSGVVDKWELLYQLNDKGSEEKPRESTRTVIEFTGTGKVLFNRMDKEDLQNVKSRSGQYVLAKDEISITDDAGNTVKWPYQIMGDTLVLVMPEVKKKFYWRRMR